MFKKVLIANRGEIAVRILRACRELGIPSVSIYEAQDSESLHVRLSDECVRIDSLQGLRDGRAILEIARQKGCDAIHPGYGFMAEDPQFAEDCARAGIAFIGPSPKVLYRTIRKVEALQQARQAGFATVEISASCFGEKSCLSAGKGREQVLAEIAAAAGQLGYPVLVKPCVGGRGRAQRMASSPAALPQAVLRSSTEAEAVYGDCRVFLEKAIVPSYKVGVQIAADRYGNVIHLGERQGLILHGNQKVVEESPASCLSPDQRVQLLQAALELARLFRYENIGTVEFIVDREGRFYFSEIKPRIQIEHPLTEMVTRFDLVQEQFRLAAGKALSLHQEDVTVQGWALQARVHAGDPAANDLPDAGKLLNVRLPNGPEVRVDTYIYSGCEIPTRYDPLLGKLVVWGPSREDCLNRMQRAIEEFQIVGPQTNLPVLQTMFQDPAYVRGDSHQGLPVERASGDLSQENRLRDLAVAAALLYVRQNRTFQPVVPPRLMSGWHQDSRKLE